MKKLTLGLVVVLTMIMFMGCSKEVRIVLDDSFLDEISGKQIRYYFVKTSSENERYIADKLYHHGRCSSGENFWNVYFVNQKVPKINKDYWWGEGKYGSFHVNKTNGRLGCSPLGKLK